MVVAGEVQDAVQHQNANFVGESVALFARLRGGAVEGNSDFAACRVGKRENVSRVIFAEELAIQAAQLAVIGEQAGDFAAAREAAQKIGEVVAAQASGGVPEQ